MRRRKGEKEKKEKEKEKEEKMKIGNTLPSIVDSDHCITLKRLYFSMKIIPIQAKHKTTTSKSAYKLM